MAKFEKNLLGFLEGRISASELNKYLKSMIIYDEEYKEYIITGNGDIVVEESSLPILTVTIEHLIRFCDTVIDGYIDPINLIPVGYAMWAGADCKFLADSKDKYKRMNRVITDWGNESYDDIEMTIENVKLWKEYLLTGSYNVAWKLSYEERKKRYDSAGEFLNQYGDLPNTSFENFFVY